MTEIMIESWIIALATAFLTTGLVFTISASSEVIESKKIIYHNK